MIRRILSILLLAVLPASFALAKEADDDQPLPSARPASRRNQVLASVKSSTLRSSRR
jgi:hypothetical protein